jgi:hypothetical protein
VKWCLFALAVRMLSTEAKPQPDCVEYDLGAVAEELPQPL